MPHPNRVTPFGDFVAEPWRGMFTGNRGCLHDGEGRIGARRWRHQNWVCCVTEFRGRWRPVMPPGRWTALFFWDEAAALAAGHRPCGECRYRAYRRFVEGWQAAGLPGEGPRGVDRVLHAARVRRDRSQVRHEAEGRGLPDGTFIDLGGKAALVAGGAARVLDAAAGGYAVPIPLPDRVTVLTPAPVVAVLAAGYRPDLKGDRRVQG